MSFLNKYRSIKVKVLSEKEFERYIICEFWLGELYHIERFSSWESFVDYSKAFFKEIEIPEIKIRKFTKKELLEFGFIEDLECNEEGLVADFKIGKGIFEISVWDDEDGQEFFLRDNLEGESLEIEIENMEDLKVLIKLVEQLEKYFMNPRSKHLKDTLEIILIK